jgi:hypothetical protein
MVSSNPAFSVPCPTCFAKVSQPCRSRRDISVHLARLDAVQPKRRITEQEIEDARSPAGGWSAKTLAAWGVPWPPPKGWRKRLTSGPGGARAPSVAKVERPEIVRYGKTGDLSGVILQDEDYPPWEGPWMIPSACPKARMEGLGAGGSSVSHGLEWCRVHRVLEELRVDDGEDRAPWE